MGKCYKADNYLFFIMDFVKLSEGAGGEEMDNLISSFTKDFYRGKWKFSDKDSAVLGKVVFTTDSYVVTPLFFPGGNIGKLCFCGTVNDLSVMGATPMGISLSLILEEGFSKEELSKIIDTISLLSNETKIPVVTGDTKVVEKGKIDKIMITTSGLGFLHDEKDVLDGKLSIGDKVIVSGSIGEHAVSLLSSRYDFKTDVISDCKPLHEEMILIRSLIKQAKDVTRGGISSVLNEICEKNNVGMLINEENVPVNNSVKTAVDFLGLNLYELACEGRLVCICSKKNASLVLDILKKFNDSASIIGEIVLGSDLVCQTKFGKKIIHKPIGNIVPRIC
jgi:hydrogenase expression/formation protein HypE